MIVGLVAHNHEAVRRLTISCRVAFMLYYLFNPESNLTVRAIKTKKETKTMPLKLDYYYGNEAELLFPLVNFIPACNE